MNNDEIKNYLDGFYTREQICDKLGIAMNTLKKYEQEIEQEFSNLDNYESINIEGKHYNRYSWYYFTSIDSLEKHLKIKYVVPDWDKNRVVLYKSSKRGNPTYFNKNYYEIVKYKKILRREMLLKI
ncbi:hypothetical protein [Vagococcus humatus]|uniref:Uncharacterized protein n=1 Tax=Vagococcus humatus TaxID=1889241 RepID=A0A429Z6A1_9ENTE|nr:hypothetical protein [Vagococcus humatus]RST89216.1 hypothetical protein C7P63_05420 [Vagococcus humatus]